MSRADVKEKGIDEAPAVYKDIFEVMKQQADLFDNMNASIYSYPRGSSPRLAAKPTT